APGQPTPSDTPVSAFDTIDHKLGRGTSLLPNQETQRPWAMRQQFRSPRYTTRWQDVPRVSA
ncbi:MAG: DUF4113 domain-containing protein, partial [Porticoccaceae bacterium]